MVLVLPALVPASMQSTPVVVAAGDLPTGTELGPQHLRTVEVASSLVPGGASSSVAELEGERLAGPVAEGGAVLPADVVGAEGPAIPEGTALVAVPVPEVLLPHLAAGTRIELLMSDPVDGTIPCPCRDPFAVRRCDLGSSVSPGSSGTERWSSSSGRAPERRARSRRRDRDGVRDPLESERAVTSVLPHPPS